ncbi:excalibur calcium-binding domain-containing protein [Natronoarchaeum rubrum]|uniref:excalibur calcium-binding domain-containing protein n=1 Tax=Natronoarchaeum rubrum TaxID=755311 RepID=UPI002112AD28|nr:excalibur calcium-binding domain-containing protein [Natronoarchaeum rubrum]
MCSDTNQQRIARIAAIIVVTFVVLATIGAGLTPAILNPDLDADQGDEKTALTNTVQEEDDEFPPSTDDVTDPVVDYDKIDLNVTLTNNRSDNDSLDYRLVVLGAIQSTNDTASGTVSCEDQTCVVNGTLDADDRAAYRLSGAIVSVSPDDDLIGEFNNGSLEGNALEGLGIGAVYSTGDDSDNDGDDDGDTSVTVDVDSSASAAASAVANATVGDDGNGDNGGPSEDPNGTDNESPTVESINYVNCSTIRIEGNGTVDRIDYNTVGYDEGGLDYRRLGESDVELPYELQREELVIQNVEVSHDGEELAQQENPDNEACVEELRQRNNESYVEDITFDGCSAAEIEGQGDGFSYTVTTEYYTEDGIATDSRTEENVTLPESIWIAVAYPDSSASTRIISEIAVTNSAGDVVAEASPPDYDACRERLGEEPPPRDYNCDDFDTWEEANEVYENSSGEYGLDGDGDGIPCEDLPGAPDDGNGDNGEDEDYNCEDFETWEEANEVYEDSPGEHGLDGDGDGVPCETLPGAPDDSEDDTTAESDDEDSEDESSSTNGEEDGESTDEDSDGTDDATDDGDEDTETGDSTDEGEGDGENGDGTDENDANGTDEDDEGSSEEDDEASEDDGDNGESNTDDESSEENGDSEEGNGEETDETMTDDSQSVLVSAGGS